MTLVYILKATTSADFDEPEIVGVGVSSEAIEKWFSLVLKESWEKMDGDSQEFYQSLEAYEDSWYKEVWPFNLVGA